MGSKEGIGDLRQDSSTVTGSRFGSGGASVVHIGKNLKTLLYDVMASQSIEVGNRTDTTGVMLESRVVKTLRFWKTF
jgi:hypothetical protein